MYSVLDVCRLLREFPDSKACLLKGTAKRSHRSGGRSQNDSLEGDIAKEANVSLVVEAGWLVVVMGCWVESLPHVLELVNTLHK